MVKVRTMQIDDAKYKVWFVVFRILSSKVECIVVYPVVWMEVYAVPDANCHLARLFHIWPEQTSFQLTAKSAKAGFNIEKECQLVPWVFGKVVGCED
jgi:hypothetical protein